MNTDRLLTAGIALCCIFAIGTSASTLATSVHTNPDDVINIKYKSLPIKPTDADELKREAQSNGDPKASRTKNHQQSSQREQQSSVSKQRKQSNRSRSRERLDFLDELLQLLRKLMQWLAWIVPVFVVAGGVAVGVRFRDRLFDATTAETTTGRESTPTRTLNPTPSNEIERAWWSMVERFGVDRPHTKTPGECAQEAIKAGGDEDAIRTLTRTFEEVRYGGASVTDERLHRIHHGTERLGDGQ